jgi:hypothetical protein
LLSKATHMIIKAAGSGPVKKCRLLQYDLIESRVLREK